MVLKKTQTNSFSNWKNFSEKETLLPEQLEKFKQYFKLLQQENKKYNLTRIIDEKDVIEYHFKESLILRKFFSVSSSKGVVDIGSGAGFPGLPLAIIFEDVPFYLIEVIGRKVSFLKMVIDQLGLKNVEVVDCDFRTFICSKKYNADTFLARASLKVSELLRIFWPNSLYKKSTLVYWASKLWQATEHESSLITKQERYIVGEKKRRLIFFKNYK